MANMYTVPEELKKAERYSQLTPARTLITEV